MSRLVEGKFVWLKINLKLHNLVDKNEGFLMTCFKFKFSNDSLRSFEIGF